MGTIIFFIIIIALVCGFVANAKTEVSRRVDNTIASFAGERGHCIYCKHCGKDERHQYSSTGYFCGLSRATSITEDTVMDCLVKPTVREADLQQLFSLNIWTPSGEQYIREHLLNQKMIYPEVHAFLSSIPKTNPEYIRPEAAETHSSRQ